MFGTKIMSKKTRGTGKSPIFPSPLAAIQCLLIDFSQLSTVKLNYQD